MELQFEKNIYCSFIYISFWTMLKRKNQLIYELVFLVLLLYYSELL